MRNLTFIFSLFLSSSGFGQTFKFVEEVAFLHLDSLTRIDTNFREFKYIFNGYVDSEKVSMFDTTWHTKGSDILFIRTPFKNLVIAEDTTMRRFNVPTGKRKRGAKDALTVFRHLKVDNLYYVLFKINYSSGGQEALLIMDRKGNLLRRRVGGFVN